MRHRHIAGLINVYEVSDPVEIKAVGDDPVIDRSFETSTCPVNWFLLKRSINALSFRGRRFPTMEPRQCSSRARAQEQLWQRLNEQIPDIKAGPVSLAPIAEWVKGSGRDDAVGILTQQLLGGLFRSDFTATQETWAAALVLVKAPRSWNLPMLFWWLTTGKLKRAKAVLAGQVGGDLSAVNAIGIAVHNIVKGLHHMRALYADTSTRTALSPDAAAKQCLRAPVSIYRQSTADGTVLGIAFKKHSLFVLNIGVASQIDDGHSLVFMENSWSRCPAALWVPAMLEGVWRRASEK